MDKKTAAKYTGLVSLPIAAAAAGEHFMPGITQYVSDTVVPNTLPWVVRFGAIGAAGAPLVKKIAERSQRKMGYIRSAIAAGSIGTILFTAPAIANRVVNIDDFLQSLPGFLDTGGSTSSKYFPKQKIESLEGKVFSDTFLSNITGINGAFSISNEVDYERQLDRLWDIKIEKYPNRPVVEQTYRDRVAKYNQARATKMSLDDYISSAQSAIEHVQRNIDWQKVGSDKNLSDRKTDLVKEICTSLDGRDLIAYAFTELLPAIDGEFNKALFDNMLRNGGREYVELIPAMFDDRLSFGPYQFTSYALRELEGKREGASIINAAMPKEARISDSVANLDGDDHHIAAYLFAIQNVASLAAQLSTAQTRTLERVWSDNRDDIVKYIATAHHGPTASRTAARRWLDNDANSDYTVSTTGRFTAYSRKTDSNFRALHR
jgi:hypothetical protein